MDNLLYILHPDNKLTQVDSLTIPNLERRRSSIQLSLDGDKGDHNDSDLSTRIKKCELRYIEAYLAIMKKVQCICTTCDSEGSEYDYDREDELLDEISDEMAALKKAEKEMIQYKQQSDRGKDAKPSVAHVERVEHVS